MTDDPAAFARLQIGVDRLAADVDRLAEKVRMIGAFEDPMNRQIVGEFHELRRKVSEMDIEGTHIAQVRLQLIEDVLDEMKADTKALRTTVRSALITAALSIVVQLVMLAILRSHA